MRRIPRAFNVNFAYVEVRVDFARALFEDPSNNVFGISHEGREL
jgi:hypothetical protein